MLLDVETFEQLSLLRFTSKITGLRKTGDFVYLNLKDESTPIVNIEDPTNPTVIGSHNVYHWVEGAEWQKNKGYRVRKNKIEIAVFE